MILSNIKIAISASKYTEALSILRSIVGKCRDDPGCLSCDIYSDVEDSSVLMLQEFWMSEERMNIHIRSGDYLNLLLFLESSIKKPEVRFDNVSCSTGMETIEKIRSTIRRD